MFEPAAGLIHHARTAGRLPDVARSVRRSLPRGRLLSEALWTRRHRSIVILLWLHVVGLGIFALLMGASPDHAVSESALVAVPALLASYDRLGRGFRSSAAAFGLATASAVLVHLSGGYVEAHFHFFVVLGILALYQDWGPFLVAIGFVVGHHAIVGMLQPDAVFNHPAARENPAFWGPGPWPVRALRQRGQPDHLAYGGAPEPARSPDRPAEPGAVRRPAGPGDGPSRAERCRRGRPDHRSR